MWMVRTSRQQLLRRLGICIRGRDVGNGSGVGDGSGASRTLRINGRTGAGNGRSGTGS